MSSAPSRPYHHGDLRAALLARAEQTLERTGPAGLSLRGLAREIGVSHGAPRRHFADKDALLAVLALDGFARLGVDLADASRVGGAFADRMRASARAYVAFAIAHPALLALMFATKHSPARPPALVDAVSSTFDPMLALLVDGQRTGEVAEGDAERLGVTVLATIHGISSLASSGMLDLAAVGVVVDDAVDRLLLGLRPR